nr:MAG TPA: hypothetical protein [Caudoviricetes sp.]
MFTPLKKILLIMKLSFIIDIYTHFMRRSLLYSINCIYIYYIE